MAIKSGFSSPHHQGLSNALRFLAVDAVEKAQSGHPGMPLGMADIATVLYQKFLKFDPRHPQWPDRDRFVLSNGHGSMLLYALNYLTGYEGMTLDQLKVFRQWGAHTAGHPEIDPSLGIETTTGPLSQGLAMAVGMALAERLLNAQFGDALVDHRTYVFVGDGCLMEGLSHEAISLAGHLHLNKLIVFFDDNAITIDGSTDLSVSDDQKRRFEAANWFVQSIDGHSPEAIEEAIHKALVSTSPSLIACKTVIGYGAPTKANTAGVHGSPLGAEENQKTRDALGWGHPPFHIPEDLLREWRAFGKRGTQARHDWEKRLSQSPQKESFQQRLEKKVEKTYHSFLKAFKDRLVAERPSMATRKLSEEVLNTIASHIPSLVGGSADLTGSNNTKASSMSVVSRKSYHGTYIHYGVREHGMAAAMNGMAVHGGIIPYGGTFLVFSDYCRPAIRLSALMRQQVIYVMTHDSLGLGEDGPTHQPIEHLASLRLIPNLLVFRPADGVETAECWELALTHSHTPSLLALTRQNVPTLREDSSFKSDRGLYFLEETKKADVCLMASGSEVSLAREVAQLLRQGGISASVVSAPCLELFDQQPLSYRQSLLESASLRVAIELGSPDSWRKYVSPSDLIIGVERFGASAPYKDLYRHFGFTADQIHLKIEKHMQGI